MFFQCNRIQKILMGSLDKDLDSKSRLFVARHLEQCPGCREMSANLEKWRAFRTDWQGNSRETEVPDGMDGRIVESIRLEAARRSLETLAGQPPRAHRLAYIGSAAATVLVLAAVFAASQFFFKPASLAPERQKTMEMAGSETKNGAAVNDPDWNAVDSFDKSIRAQDDQLESLLMSACSLAVITPTTTGTTAQESAGPLDQTLSLLHEASDLRVFTASNEMDASDQSSARPTLILAKYPSVVAEKAAEDLKTSLSTCKIPCQIEIIREEDLPELSGWIGSDKLPDLDDGASGFTWIKILIGM